MLTGEELSFTVGDQTRQYIHVSEVPRMIGLAVEKNLPSGVYNIEAKKTVIVRENVSKIHRFMGKKMPSDCFGAVQRNDVTMKYLALEGKKLREAIGFEANISIVDVIDKY